MEKLTYTLGFTIIANIVAMSDVKDILSCISLSLAIIFTSIQIYKSKNKK